MNLKQLKKEGYQGNDTNMEISLFEYGLIWKEDGPDYRFIYGVAMGDNKDGDREYNLFDWSCIAQNTNPKTEWGWIDWNDTFRYCGMDILKLPNLPQMVSELVSYFGHEEILGSSYYPFKIEEEE